MYEMDAFWSGPIMGCLDIQFDIAVSSALKSFREFKTNPNEKNAQIDLFRALRHASFVCGSSSSDCAQEITKLFKIAEEASSILDNGLKKTKAIRGIQQQVKDIRKTYQRITVV